MIVIDMDIPNTCNECKFCRNYECAIIRMSVESAYKTYQKYPWCPIVAELPKGHGRLVDGDAIISSHESGYWHLHNVIKNASTIIEADKER